MIIILSNGKQIEILGVDLRNSTVDFKWIDGVYNGECSFPITFNGLFPTEAEIEKAANAELT